jgi:beta-glucosidase/6-phospho-beta-glucosidase/beta-galactosidase
MILLVYIPLLYIFFSHMLRNIVCYTSFTVPGWLNELGSWIANQLIQAYHQYGVGFRPSF